MNSPILKKVIIREVIDNPSVYLEMPDDELEKLFDKKSNPKGFFSDAMPTPEFKRIIKMAPRNSIIAIEAGPSTTSKNLGVYYPLLSGHLAMPAKPGEAVWVLDGGLFESFSKGDDIVQSTSTESNAEDMLSVYAGEIFCKGYWLSRVTEPNYNDDLNFTHADRTKSVEYVRQQVTAGPRSLPSPSFPNGIYNSTDDGIGYTGKQTLSDDHNYNVINTKSLANFKTSREPVPRFTKRPGDLVLQGSNNTLICLGEDRPASKNAKSNSQYPEPPVSGPRKLSQAGTIDLVAGRGITRENNKIEYKKEQLSQVENTRQEQELEKRIWAQSEAGRVVKDAEGDPSFSDDLTRIYLSMKTDGDANFGFTEASQLPNPGSPLEPVSQAPYSIIKSDEVRIIARPAGGMRIIKEGTRVSETDPGDQAVIAMQPDGTIMIDGPKIIVGSGNEKGNGAGEQVFIGKDATEPLVLGNELKDLLDSHFDNLKTWIASKFDTHIHPSGVGPTGPPTVIGDDAGTGTTKGKTVNFLSKNAKTK